MYMEIMDNVFLPFLPICTFCAWIRWEVLVNSRFRGLHEWSPSNDDARVSVNGNDGTRIVRVLFKNSTSPFIVPPKYLTNERLLDPSTDAAAESTKAIFRSVPEERMQWYKWTINRDNIDLIIEKTRQEKDRSFSNRKIFKMFLAKYYYKCTCEKFVN